MSQHQETIFTKRYFFELGHKCWWGFWTAVHWHCCWQASFYSAISTCGQAQNGKQHGFWAEAVSSTRWFTSWTKFWRLGILEMGFQVKILQRPPVLLILERTKQNSFHVLDGFGKRQSFFEIVGWLLNDRPYSWKHRRIFRYNSLKNKWDYLRQLTKIPRSSSIFFW